MGHPAIILLLYELNMAAQTGLCTCYQGAGSHFIHSRIEQLLPLYHLSCVTAGRASVKSIIL